MDENFTFPSETTDSNENLELNENENSIIQIQEKKDRRDAKEFRK